MFKNKSGFTVLESLIVLLITMISLSLSLMLLNILHIKDDGEKYFWGTFKEEWQLFENQSIQSQVITTVNFNTSYISFENELHSRPVVINYPSGLKLLNRPTQIIIHDNGYVSPKTIRWYAKRTNQTWHQKFQLGWGVYRLEKIS